MIASLRRRHERMIVGLVLLVPPIALVALASRPEVPTMEPLPASLGAVVSGVAHGVAQDAVTATLSFPSLPVSALLSGPRGDRWLTLRATAPLAAPDPLVYWVPGDRPFEAKASVPESASLLGAWDGQLGVFRLPASAGAVWLYSLAHQRVLGALSVPGADPQRGES